jgi:hypothetical protein
MALSDEVLKNFFTKTKKPLAASLPQKEGSRLIQTSRYRVFDDPIAKDSEPTIQAENLGQTQDKPRPERRTNLGQTQDKPKTNLRQTQDKKGLLHKKPRTNLGQTQDILPILCNFYSLVGLQRKITLFIYEICKVSRSRITSPLSTEHLASTCQTTKFSVQKTIQRLENKKVISRNSFKNGRGGWTQYELSDAIFQEIMHEETQSKLRTNLGQNLGKLF